ncbi:hypothetical protein LCGC14_0857200 [marine sediment metagenome]|uniref:Uncharacterized protein n=1 Tax=marine sediment metagenome TaxID=412755 RepID=A0A0F9PDA8_9ZZZZ
MSKLTDIQMNEVLAECIPNGVPVRFMVGGQALNICTGELNPKHINVINSIVYWNFTKKTISKIAGWLNARPEQDRI